MTRAQTSLNLVSLVRFTFNSRSRDLPYKFIVKKSSIEGSKDQPSEEFEKQEFAIDDKLCS
jgi:hypothetical protein